MSWFLWLLSSLAGAQNIGKPDKKKQKQNKIHKKGIKTQICVAESDLFDKTLATILKATVLSVGMGESILNEHT